MKNPPMNESPEQKKIRLQREAEALFLDINSSFGKASEKAKKEKPKKESAVVKFIKECNSIAAAMETPTWKPSAIVHYIIRQKCGCCGESPECVGGTLVRHINSRNQTIWDFPRPDVAKLPRLPQIVIEEETKVEACPSCIRNGSFNQAPLFFEVTDLPEMSPVESWQKDHDDSGEELLIEADEEEELP